MPEQPPPKLRIHPWRDHGPSAPGLAHAIDLASQRAEPPAPAGAPSCAPGGASRSRRYVELAVTSNFSFLMGGSHPEEIVERAAHLGYRAVAVTDRHTLAGIVRAHVAAKERGLHLVVGSRVAVFERLCDEASVDQHRNDAAAAERLACEMLLYPTDLASYGRLCRLLTLGKRRAVKGQCRLAVHDVLDHAAECGGRASGTGLLCIVLPPRVLDGAFVELIEGLRRALGDRLSIAITRLGDADDNLRSRQLVMLSEWTGVPLVAVNDVHYHVPERRPLQDVLTCIRLGRTLDRAGYALFPNAERHLRPPEAMESLFADLPDAVARAGELADRTRGFSLDQLRYRYPSEVVPDGVTPMDHLRELTWRGARSRYPADRHPDGVPDRVRRQIEHEFRLIDELQYAQYFLTVHDLVAFARSRDILCQGRGAAANSAVCYCLGITAVDPNRIDVLFERFISKERNEPPDIDVDFEHERREEVIQYLYRKYGRDRAALAAEVISYRGRSAVREVGKALGLSLDCVERLSSGIDWWHDGGVDVDRVREIGLNPRDPTILRLAKLSTEILGFPRHLSQHVGGFVITDGPLCEFVPIENAAMVDRTVIEWDKDDIDAMGMLKVDVLALGMLTCIRKAIDLVNDDAALTAGDAARSREERGGIAEANARAVAVAPELLPPSHRDGGRGTVRAANGGGGDSRRVAVDAAMGNACLGVVASELLPTSHRDGGRGTVRAANGGVGVGGGGGEESEGCEGDGVSRSLARDGEDVHPSPFHAAPASPSVPEPGAVPLLRVPSIAPRLRVELPVQFRDTPPPAPLAFHTIPSEDPQVYDMICRADTVGVFQIESRAQMSMLPRLRPRSFYDLVIEVAIVRPGPIQGDMVHPYLRRRNGEEPIAYPDDAVRAVLGKTLGVPLFQEQAMALAIVAAGFTPGEADQLRRAIAAWKRKGNRLAEFAAKLESGMVARGYTRQFAQQVFTQIQGFSGYGFPESHAASFALLVYVSAWLKCHQPAAFAASLINSQPMGFYAPAQIVRDVIDHGVAVRAVDVNASEWDCTLERREPPWSGRLRSDGMAPMCEPPDPLAVFRNARAFSRTTASSGEAKSGAGPPGPHQALDVQSGKGGGVIGDALGGWWPLDPSSLKLGRGAERAGATRSLPTRRIGSRERDGPLHDGVGQRVSLPRREREALLRDPSMCVPARQPSVARDQPALRLGMRLVRGLVEEEAMRIATVTHAMRAAGRWFDSIESLWRASGVRVATLRRLAAADAFRSMGLDRQRALWHIRALRDESLPLLSFGEEVRHASSSRPAPGNAPANVLSGALSGVLSGALSEAPDGALHGSSSDVGGTRTGPVGAEAMQKSRLPSVSDLAAVAHDYAAIGLSLKRHPMACIRPRLAARGAVPCGTLRDERLTPQGARLSVAGVVLVRQRPSTANGIVFMTLEDESGIANLIVRPKVYARYRKAARHAVIVVAHGLVERRDNVVHLLVRSVEDASAEADAIDAMSRDFH